MYYSRIADHVIWHQKKSSAMFGVFLKVFFWALQFVLFVNHGLTRSKLVPFISNHSA